MGNVESNLWNENKCSLYNKISKTYIIPTRTMTVFFFPTFINKKLNYFKSYRLLHCLVEEEFYSSNPRSCQNCPN